MMLRHDEEEEAQISPIELELVKANKALRTVKISPIGPKLQDMVNPPLHIMKPIFCVLILSGKVKVNYRMKKIEELWLIWNK